MKKFLTAALLLLLCCSTSVFSQKKTDGKAHVRGNVTFVDQNSKQTYPCFGAVVKMFFRSGDRPDSLYSVVGFRGEYSFSGIEPQEVRLEVRQLGFAVYEATYPLEAGPNVIYVSMKEQKEVLEEARVTAEMELSRQDKDTVIFNAAAVTTSEDESAKAILDQLPGFRVEGESIKVDGKEVKKTYVNGALIFGDAPITAVNTLKASEVKDIKVYDEMDVLDKRRGIKNAEKQRVLDITTKDKMSSLTEISASAVGGLDETGQERYKGTAVAVFSSEMKSGQALVSTTNVGGMLAGTGLFRTNSAEAYTSLMFDGQPLTEYAQMTKLQLGGDKYWKDRDFGNSLKATYLLDHVKNRSASMAMTDYFETPESPERTYTDSTTYSSLDRSHSISFIADLKDTPLKSVKADLNIILGESRSSSLSSERIVNAGLLQGDEALKEIYSRAEDRDEGGNTTVAGNINWTNNDARRFKPTAHFGYIYSNNNNLSWTVDTLASSYTRRQLSSDGLGKGIVCTSEFSLDMILKNTEEVTRRLTLGAQSTYDNHKSRQMTVDAFGVTEPVIDLASSHDYTWNSVSNTASARYFRSKGSEHNLFAELSAGLLTNINNEEFPARYAYNRSYANLGANLFMNAKSNFLGVKFSTAAPSLDQTRDRLNDENPLVLTGGNKNLKQSAEITSIMNYNVRFRKKTTSLNITANVTMGFRDIVTHTIYFAEDTPLPQWDNYLARAGAMLNTFENSTRPSYILSLFPSFSMMFLDRKLTLRLSGNNSFSSRAQYMGQDLLVLRDLSFSLNPNVEYHPSGKTHMSLASSLSWASSTNSLGTVLSDRINWGATAFVMQDVGKHLNIRATYETRKYRYLNGAGQDNSFNNFNICLTTHFFNRSLNVSLLGADLLHSGTMYSTSTTSTAYSQFWTPTYGRYFLLGVQYNFRHRK